MRAHNPPGNAIPPSPYSHGAEVEGELRWLFTAGQVGRRKDGEFSADFAEQCRQAWANLANVLAAADMGMADVVKLNFMLTDKANVAAFRPTWEEAVGPHRPPATMLIVDALGRDGLLIEIEAVAAKARR